MTSKSPRTHGRPGADAGIAVGPILFVAALLAVFTALMSQNNGVMSAAAVTDRIDQEVTSQANMIRQKVMECWMVSMGKPSAAWPTSPATGTPVSAAACPADPAPNNLWTGQRPALLPQPPNGFDAWTYVNLATSASNPCGNPPAGGGICIYTQPTASWLNNTALRDGLRRAAARFSAEEASWSDSGNRRFTVWIRRN